MNRIGICLILFCLSFRADAQIYTLQQCIDSAIARNTGVKQAGLLTETADVNRRQARANLLPVVNADLSHALNLGRSINPSTNTYVNQNAVAAGYGANARVVLFNGLSLQQRVKQTATAYEATKLEGQQVRDDLVLNVILAYLQVLNSEDQVQLALKQQASTQQALDRLQTLNREGAVRPSDVADLKGQLMNDRLSLLQASNALESAKLLLAQLMNLPYQPSLKVVRIDTQALMTVYAHEAEAVYRQSLQSFAQVRSAALRRQSAAYAIRVAKGERYPVLFLNGGMNSQYYSIARDGAGFKIPYSTQLRNNKFSSLGLGISIPIFNASLARNRVKLATIAWRNSELVETETKRQLRQEIDQAYLNMTTAYERYQLLVDQVEAYQTSFKAAEVRYQSGVGTSIDYLAAKDRLDRAQLNLLNAQYDFVLRKKVLEYYEGKRE